MTILQGRHTLYNIDARETGTTQKCALGTKGVGTGGRIYRYILAGGSDLSPGKLAVASTAVNAHGIDANTCVATAIGATEVAVTIGAAALVANEYAHGGFLTIQDGTGQGISYLISSHPASVAGSESITFKLAEPIEVALDTTTEVDLVQSPYYAAVISAADQLDQPVGVPNITIGDAEYGWVQTGGPCSVLMDETLAVGSMVVSGSSTVGAVEAFDYNSGEPVVGFMMQHAGVESEYQTVFLTLDR